MVSGELKSSKAADPKPYPATAVFIIESRPMLRNMLVRQEASVTLEYCRKSEAEFESEMQVNDRL